MRGGVLVGILIAGLATADAAAACAPQTIRQQDERAPVILTGVVESGPVTPARVRVDSWQRSTGPAEVDLDTGIYDGAAFDDSIAPQPGERWRIFGVWHDGTLVTGQCYGSHAIAADSQPPTFTLGRARAVATPSTFAGRPLNGALPRLNAKAVAKGKLRVASWVQDVRLVGATGGAKLTRSHGTWTLRLPPHGRPGGTLVADTGDAFYAVGLRVA